MYKIFFTVRNRLSITIKAITALKKHSTIPHQIYVYDNLTNYKTPEHFVYWSMLYEEGLISQVTFTTKESTFNAFSKASSCNMFGLQHEQDPKKDSYDFLVFLDNDVIVTPGWDTILLKAWNDVKNMKMHNIKIIGQKPGGIMNHSKLDKKIAGYNAIVGKNGGSGLWSVRNNFFTDIGYINLSRLIGSDKRHDSTYWTLIERSTQGKNYIIGLETKLGIHCGKIAKSVCNVLNKNSNKKEDEKKKLIMFEKEEKFIDDMSFDEFYKFIESNKDIITEW